MFNPKSDLMKAKLIKKDGHFYSLILVDNKELLATTEDSEGSLKLSVANCRTIEFGIDLDSLADEYCTYDPKNTKEVREVNLIKMGFKSGIYKALELIGNNKFTEYDIIREIHIWDNHININEEDKGCLREITKRVLNLKQSEWDVEIVTEEKYGWDLHSDPPQKEFSHLEPKLDGDGCLILKRI